MADNQVRLLLIQANPPGTVVLDTDIEERNLQAALRRGQQHEHFAHPVRLPAARISDLLSELRAQQPHILHFMGHGDGAGGLWNNNSTNASALNRYNWHHRNNNNGFRVVVGLVVHVLLSLFWSNGVAAVGWPSGSPWSRRFRQCWRMALVISQPR